MLAILLFTVTDSPAEAGLPYAKYGPACQWLRLRGEWERPQNLAADEPILLTIHYSLPGQKTSTPLVTNYPVWKKQFVFVLSGIDERIDGVLLVPPEFSFSYEVSFHYYGTSADRRWKSGWKESIYRPYWEEKNGTVRCHTAVQLEPLRLEAQ